MMKKKEPNKKKPEKKNAFSMEIFEFKKPELDLNDKKINAIKTIMNDECLRYKDNAELRAIVDGYEAGKKGKGDKK